MQGPILVRVWDYDKKVVPSTNFQQIDMLVPNDFVPYNRISSFIVKWYNVNFAFKAGTSSFNQVWVDTYIKPLDYQGNSLVHNNTNFRIRSSSGFAGGSGSINSHNETTTGGKDGQYSRSGGTTSYYKVEDVGYRIVPGNNTQIGLNSSSSSNVQYYTQNAVNPWTGTSVQNNNWQANYSGTSVIHNRQSSWRSNTNFTFQAPGSWYNNGFYGFGYNQMGQDAGNTTSNYYFMNSNYAGGVRLSMLPYNFSTANNGSGGSSGQVNPTHFGIVGGRFELWINTVPASY
tara:strand:- start:31 stop:891 length:861 start_codon:yes stop_codon:yes gene_type:complete